MPEQVNARYFKPLQELQSYERIPAGIEAKVDDALCRFEFIGDDVVRIQISHTGVLDDSPSISVPPQAVSPAVNVAVRDEPGLIVLQTRRMDLRIGRAPFTIDAYRADGSVIFETASIDGKRWAYAHLNDEFLIARNSKPADLMLGLGEKTGRLNRNGRNFTLWNTDVLNPTAAGVFIAGREKTDLRSDPTSIEFDPYYISIPFFQHLSHAAGHAAGFFVDNPHLAHYEFDHGGDQYRIHFAGGQYVEYVFAGPSLSQILSAYTELTGRMSPPPLWALGYHQCRWFKYSGKDVAQLARRFRELQIPCDCLWLDIDYMNGYRVFTWNKELFPDPVKMTSELREKGFRMVTIIDPGVKAEPGYEVYDDGAEQDIFCRTEGGAIYRGQVWPGETAFPDFSTPEGRRWWGERNARHVASGIAGIWNDMNEPATGEIAPESMWFSHGAAPHHHLHNHYALLMAQGTAEGLLSADPSRRPFILSRAGSAGIQRYAANWLGDNMSRWEHLWLSMPMTMGLGLSGQPFVGADIGGFAEDTTAELLTRWMQCGALTPFCRNHNVTGCIAQYPWSFDNQTEERCRRALALRYRLMPAIYAAFLQSAETGLPVQRPLVLNDQADALSQAINDQFLLGDNLLVAPVYKQGATSREVYLPRGTWHNLFTGEVLAGGRMVKAPAPLDYIPVYARGGAVIPEWPEAPASTMGYYPAEIELHVYIPREDGQFRSMLHEDDGETFALRQGAFYRTEFLLRRHGTQLSLSATVTGQGFREFRREKFALVFHSMAPANIRIDAVPVEASAGGDIRVANTGRPFHLTADLA